jgi:hypothetical protein
MSTPGSLRRDQVAPAFLEVPGNEVLPEVPGSRGNALVPFSPDSPQHKEPSDRMMEIERGMKADELEMQGRMGSLPDEPVPPYQGQE